VADAEYLEAEIHRHRDTMARQAATSLDHAAAVQRTYTDWEERLSTILGDSEKRLREGPGRAPTAAGLQGWPVRRRTCGRGRTPVCSRLKRRATAAGGGRGSERGAWRARAGRRVEARRRPEGPDRRAGSGQEVVPPRRRGRCAAGPTHRPGTPG
jgi:hypothetical protein